MAQVAIRIASRTYDLTCGDGEEDRVRDLAAYVDEKVSLLRQQLPAVTEVKLLVMAAVLLAEESLDARTAARAARIASEAATGNAESLASTLEELITARVDKMSKKVSGAA